MWHGNKMADREAKRAVEQRTRAIPAGYTGTSHRAIRTLIKHELAKRRRTEYRRQSQIGSHLLSREFFSWNLDTDPDFRPSDDHRMLTRHALGIITMLRTGHSRCYLSQHIQMHKAHYMRIWAGCNGDIQQMPLIQCTDECCVDNNSGLCPDCNVKETETHFLLECPARQHLRHETFGPWVRVYPLLQLTFSLKTLLFPPRRLPWRFRKQILTQVVRFSVQSGRFKRYF